MDATEADLEDIRVVLRAALTPGLTEYFNAESTS
jgi:hypothetical protein